MMNESKFPKCLSMVNRRDVIAFEIFFRPIEREGGVGIWNSVAKKRPAPRYRVAFDLAYRNHQIDALFRSWFAFLRDYRYNALWFR